MKLFQLKFILFWLLFSYLISNSFLISSSLIHAQTDTEHQVLNAKEFVEELIKISDLKNLTLQEVIQMRQQHILESITPDPTKEITEFIANHDPERAETTTAKKLSPLEAIAMLIAIQILDQNIFDGYEQRSLTNLLWQIKNHFEISPHVNLQESSKFDFFVSKNPQGEMVVEKPGSLEILSYERRHELSTTDISFDYALKTSEGFKLIFSKPGKELFNQRQIETQRTNLLWAPLFVQRDLIGGDQKATATAKNTLIPEFPKNHPLYQLQKSEILAFIPKERLPTGIIPTNFSMGLLPINSLFPKKLTRPIPFYLHYLKDNFPFLTIISPQGDLLLYNPTTSDCINVNPKDFFIFTAGLTKDRYFLQAPALTELSETGPKVFKLDHHDTKSGEAKTAHAEETNDRFIPLEVTQANFLNLSRVDGGQNPLIDENGRRDKDGSDGVREEQIRIINTTSDPNFSAALVLPSSIITVTPGKKDDIQDRLSKTLATEQGVLTLLFKDLTQEINFLLLKRVQEADQAQYKEYLYKEHLFALPAKKNRQSAKPNNHYHIYNFTQITTNPLFFTSETSYLSSLKLNINKIQDLTGNEESFHISLPTLFKETQRTNKEVTLTANLTVQSQNKSPHQTLNFNIILQMHIDNPGLINLTIVPPRNFNGRFEYFLKDKRGNQDKPSIQITNLQPLSTNNTHVRFALSVPIPKLNSGYFTKTDTRDNTTYSKEIFELLHEKIFPEKTSVNPGYCLSLL